MKTVTAEETQAYIDKFYISRRELSRRAEVAEQRIVELAKAQCIPPHSYEVRRDTVFTSAFGEYKLPSQPETYYHPDVVHWIKRANELAKNHPLPEVARRVRRNLESEVETALGRRPLPWSDGMDHAWAYLMDGSWSLCLKDLNASHLVAKEVARARIADVVAKNPDNEFSTEDRHEVEAAFEQYESAVLPFAPHEYPESSRQLELEPAAEKAGLRGTAKAPAE